MVIVAIVMTTKLKSRILMPPIGSGKSNDGSTSAPSAKARAEVVISCLPEQVGAPLITEFARDGWGEGGEEFAWWCTEAPEAFTAHEPPVNHEKLDVMTLPMYFDRIWRSARSASSMSRRVGIVDGFRQRLGLSARWKSEE